MSLQNNPDIQAAIAIHLASGKYASAEEVVLVALQHLARDEAEFAASLADLRESADDEVAGRMKPVGEVAADIRAKHGFGTS